MCYMIVRYTWEIRRSLNFRNWKKITLSIATPEGLDQKKFVADLRKILRSTTKLMQHIPFNDYTFIMMEPGGGGLEHWNSQAVFTYGSFNFENDLAYKRF